MDLFLVKSLTNGFVSYKTCNFLLHKTLIDGVVWIIVMFLSVVWTLILTAPIHCRASIAEQVIQCYISPNLMKKQTHLHPGKHTEGEDMFSKGLFVCELFV